MYVSHRESCQAKLALEFIPVSAGGAGLIINPMEAPVW